MKLMIASDLHGAADDCRAMLRAYDREGAQKLILLGDLLYHGPRNDLPPDYRPKEVISLLNGRREELLCVRGNCEAEVDQMVLDFPVLADYMIWYLGERMVFATHGHLHNEQNLPPLKRWDVLLHGHTHLMALEGREGYLYANPGSVALPKGGNPKSYLVYEEGVFFLKTLEGQVCGQYRLS